MLKKILNKISPNHSQNEFYTLEDSSLESTLEIFSGAWASKVPGANVGYADLFDDSRIKELSEKCGGFEGKKILEIGPLEAAHSYMMHQGGASDILAIEANSKAYLKSLIVKEEFQLNNLRIKFADAMKSLAGLKENFDLSVASGVLYHMSNPLQFIKDLARTSDQVFIWTHYYVDNMTNVSRPKFSESEEVELDGFKVTAYKYYYGGSLGLKSFCGGTKPYTLWIRRDEIIKAFMNYGFTKHEIFQEVKDHPNGPCYCVLFSKS